MRRFRRARAPWQRPTGYGSSVFVGREHELAQLAQAVGLEAGDDGGGRANLVLLTGPAGTGKTSLLHELRRRCDARRPARCGPVVDLRTPPGLETLLETISASFVTDDDDPFRGFRESVRKARDQRAQRKGTLVTGTDIAQQAATKANELAPGLTTGAIRGGVELLNYGAHALDRPLDADAVERTFIECLHALARSDPNAPLVLFFAYIDRWPEHETVGWIRSRLLPAAVASPITVVLSGETEAGVADLGRLGVSRLVPIGRFSLEDSFTFVERAIGVPRTSRLAQQLVADCDGFPERLERYRVYFSERDPDARKAEEIPERAREWAGSGSTLGQLERFTTPAAQRLVVYAAVLRWFNAPLLREVAAAAGLGDEGADAVAELLDSTRRPPWIGFSGGGWGITVSSRRRDFVDECRKLDPAVYRDVHERALAYHRARLDALGVASRPPAERFDNSDYVSTLAELLYHQIALDPAEGLAQICNHVAEALVSANFAEAAELADVGPELRLSRDCRLLLRELRDTAAAIDEGRFSDASVYLDRIVATAGVTKQLAGAVAYLSGVCTSQLGQSSSEAIGHHRRAEELLGSLPEDPAVMRLRVPNLLSLASQTAEATDQRAMTLVRRAAALAKALDDEELLADVDRARAQLVHKSDAEGALRHYERALSRLESPEAAMSVAALLASRADFLCDLERREEARADYRRALELCQQRKDAESEAWVAVRLLTLELADGDAAAAKKWHAKAVELRPKDAFVRNGVALAYHNQWTITGEDPELLASAVQCYDEALGLQKEAVMLSNRGDAHAQLARNAEHEAARGEWAAALADLEEAHRRAPRDVRIATELSKLQRETGNARAAAATAAEAAQELVLAIRAYTRGHGPARRAMPRELRQLFYDVLALPIEGGPVAFARACSDAFPRSGELARVLATALRDVYEQTGAPEDANAALDALGTAEQRFAAAGESAREVECGLNRAELYAALRSWDAAHAAVARVLELDPANAAAVELSERIRRLARRDEWGDEKREALFDAPVRVLIADDLLPLVDPAQSGDSTLFDEMLPSMRAAVRSHTGVAVPGVGVSGDHTLPWRTMRFELHGIAKWVLVVEGDFLAGAEPEVCADVAGVSGLPAVRPWDGGPATWLSAADAALVEQAGGIPVWSVNGTIAGTVQMLVERELATFVGVEQAAAIAWERGWTIPDSRRPQLADLARRLVEAGIGLDLPAPVVERLVSLSPRELEPELAALAAEQEHPREPPTAHAYAHGGTGTAPAGLTATVTVRIPEGAADLALADDLVAAANRLCDGRSLPSPAIVVVEDRELAPGSFAVEVEGVTRFRGRAQTRLEWEMAHPAAGPDGRTGLFPAADFGFRTAVGRAVEQVLWDDPGLLLTPAMATTLVADALGEAAPPETVDGLALALREVAHRRVPLSREQLPDVLRLVADLGVPSRDRATVERHDRSPDRTIPDGLPLGIRDTVRVELDEAVVSLRVRVHVRHPRPVDLRVLLEAPDGTLAVLRDQNVFSETDLTFEVTPAVEPALNAFVGLRAAGDWSLHVADVSEGETGTLAAWTLELFAADNVKDEATPTDDAAEQLRCHIVRVERMTRALRPYDVSVRLGTALYDAVLADPVGEDAPYTALDSVLYTVALAPQPDLWKLGLDLDPWEFETVVNDLPRARGTIPPHSVFRPYVTDGAAAAGVDPWTCVAGTWMDPAAGDGIRPREWLVTQVARMLHDEIAELCDLGWTERRLVLLAEWFPALAATLRDRYGPERTAYTLGRLASQNYSVRNVRLWETMLSRDAETLRARDFDASAPEGLSVAEHPGALAELVARELRETVWDGAERWAIALDEAAADELEAAVAGGSAPEPVYAYPADSLLDALDELIRDGAPRLLVTPRNIRRHVRRLLRAQFPTVIIGAADDVDSVVITHRLAPAARGLVSPRT